MGFKKQICLLLFTTAQVVFRLSTLKTSDKKRVTAVDLLLNI